MLNQPLVSIIVPTKNSAKFLEACLVSIKNQTYKNIEVVINDDKRTNDNTAELIVKYQKKGLNIIYIRENISTAQGRKKGVEYTSGQILLHLDSDMKITEDLVIECVDLINKRFDALVIHEESYGTTFWAKCKWLEKKCYEGIEQIESLRCIRKDIYKKVGGHNKKMVFSEDKDLDLKVRCAGYKIGRTKNIIFHNEGNLSLFKTLKKKLGYSKTANVFAKEYPEEFKWQINILNRYKIYFRNIKYLFFNPFLYIGMLFMKTCEFGFGGLGYLIGRIKQL